MFFSAVEGHSGGYQISDCPSHTVLDANMNNFSGSRFVKVKKETRIEEILDYSQGATIRILISPFPKGIRI